MVHDKVEVYSVRIFAQRSKLIHFNDISDIPEYKILLTISNQTDFLK